jgi:hypothetical protein
MPRPALPVWPLAPPTTGPLWWMRRTGLAHRAEPLTAAAPSPFLPSIVPCQPRTILADAPTSPPTYEVCRRNLPGADRRHGR